MPNTLGHIGIQGPLNRLLFKGAYPQWMLLGCLIPDIPWMIQRALAFIPGIDPYTLRLYSLNQASLFFCLLLAAALALTTRKPPAIFLVLAVNSLLHLLLDATQIKWANGVHLLVPVSWSMLHLDWFWPEYPAYHAATVAGLLFLAITWKKTAATDLHLGPPGAKKTVLVLGLLLLYGLSPFVFFQQALQADNHFCRTLLHVAERPGKTIELDRVRFSRDNKTVRIFTRETLALQGQLPDASGLVSIRGRFTTPDTIEVTAWHQHNQYRAKAASLGLLLIAALWAHTLIRKKLIPRPPNQGALS